MNRQSYSLNQGFLFSLLIIIFMAGLVGDSYAQRRGGWGGGSGYSAPVYRPAPPRPAMPSQITPQGPRVGASIGGRPSPGSNRAANTVRPLPPSIKPDSSVARIPSYTGRITTKGAPIIVSRTGRTYSVPQQGVFSTRITTTYQTIKTTLVKRLGSGKVVVLQERIAKVATAKKVVTAKIGGGGFGAGSSVGNGGDGKKRGIKDAFNEGATAQYKPLGRGSTANLLDGSTLPRNVREEQAVKQAMSSPQAGVVLTLKMNDRRWPHSDGWVKMSQTVKSGGELITVHYVRNPKTEEIDDFKIILSGTRPQRSKVTK